MSDPYIAELLRIVTEDLWEWREPVHFVVLPLDKDATLASVQGQSKQFRKCGLQVVFFDNGDGTFLGLDTLIKETLEMCPPTVEDKPLMGITADDEKPRPDGTAKHVTLTSERSQMSAVSEAWLEEVNSITEKSLRKSED
jgi:hypothetical protein